MSARSILGGIAAVAVALVVSAAAHGPAVVAGTPADAYVLCAEEDASTPGQQFPCYWPGGANRRGETYVVTGPNDDPADLFAPGPSVT
jgi:hypothetical protein